MKPILRLTWFSNPTGEVLVSNVVHGLVAGPGSTYESREVQLRGLKGLHRLYSVDLAQTDQSPAIAEQLGPHA
jgi:hypothetical protein